MGKIHSSARFSEEFGIDSASFARLGVLDPTLSLDTKLFIDPLLLPNCQFVEISRDGVAAFQKHFLDVLRLLKVSTKHGDASWKAAAKRLTAREIPGTCLGYGQASTRGSSAARNKTSQLLETAEQIVRVGVDDPYLFALLSLFEPGFGPDILSDLTTNAIIEPLLKLNERLLRLPMLSAVPRKPFTLALQHQANLPENPHSPGTPVILVPKDLLRDLPLASDWDGVAAAAAHNAQLRAQVGQHIAELWAKKSRRDKDRLRSQVLKSAKACRLLLQVVRSQKLVAYDVDKDPSGYHKWSDDGARLAGDYPLPIPAPSGPWTRQHISECTDTILKHFEEVVAQDQVCRLFYGRKETYAQRLFYSLADAYCRASGSGLKVGYDPKIGTIAFEHEDCPAGASVDLKLSSNPSLVGAYQRQLAALDADSHLVATFVVLDVGNLGQKDQDIVAARNDRKRTGKPVTDFVVIDIPKPSRRTTKQMSPTKILFMAADPMDQTPLRFGNEVHAIRAALRSASHRAAFTLEQIPATQLRDLISSLVELLPGIVHFCGHSGTDGICLEDGSGKTDFVTADGLTEIFKAIEHLKAVKLVVLNSCLSEEQAKTIRKYVPCVIGMTDEIGDGAAIRFAETLYQVLGAGRDVQTAFDMAVAGIRASEDLLEDADMPRLLVGDGVNPREICFSS